MQPTVLGSLDLNVRLSNVYEPLSAVCSHELSMMTSADAHMTVQGMQQISQSQPGPHGMSMQGLVPAGRLTAGLTSRTGVVVAWAWWWAWVHMVLVRVPGLTKAFLGCAWMGTEWIDSGLVEEGFWLWCW